MIRNGMRVVRGPSWEWQEQDKGEGNLGTIMAHDRERGSVTVEWDTTIKEEYDLYRAGHNGFYVLRLFCVADTGVAHLDVTCDHCQKDNIRGFRFKCNHCPNYDMCIVCYMAGGHDTQHSFTRFDSSQHDGVCLSPRCYAYKSRVINITATDWGGINVEDDRALTYYRDHLPIAGLDMPVTIEASCPFLIGERVIVTVDKFKVLQEGHWQWDPEMIHVINQIGTVVWWTEGQDTEVIYENHERTWTINNIALTRVGPFCEGDSVYISTNITELEKYQQLHCRWDSDMEKLRGKQGKIENISNSGNLMVRMEMDGQVFEFSPLCCNRKASPIDMSVCMSGKQAFHLMRKGHRVTRGSDWKWGDQDRNGIGVIKKIRKQQGIVNVKWDHGDSNSYRMGHESCFDLRLMDPNQTDAIDSSDSNSDSEEIAGFNTESRTSNHICKICEDRERDAVFECGHGCCMTCSKSLSRCHICREPIKKVIQIYF